MTIAVLSCGWFGLPLAKSLVGLHNVHGAYRTNVGPMEHSGIVPFQIFVSGSKFKGPIEAFLKADVLVFNIPPSKIIDYSLAIQALIKNVQQSDQLKRVIHVSSTSIYPLVNGIVNEDMPTSELKEGDVLYAETELSNQLQIPVDILRFAGLVGRNRHPVKTLSGRNLNQTGNAAVNLVHLDDCIAICHRILKRRVHSDPLLLNICADNHPSKKVYYTTLANSLNLTPPSYIGADPDRFKIVSNTKSKKLLNYEYIKPDVYDF